MAEAGGPAPEPLRVWVGDACNGVQNTPVTFTVVGGNGTVNQKSEVTVLTGDTGHAEVDFTLGLGSGNNIVDATFPTNPAATARFVVFGLRRDENQPTAFSGVVLDNAESPVQGATCVLLVAGEILQPIQTDIDGRFRFDGVPAAGPAELTVVGGTAFHIGGAAGQNIPQGSYPALHYEPIIVPNGENSLPTPIRLPRLDPDNSVSFDNTSDVTLTVAGIAGLRMKVKAGSMTRADGTVPALPGGYAGFKRSRASTGRGCPPGPRAAPLPGLLVRKTLGRTPFY